MRPVCRHVESSQRGPKAPIPSSQSFSLPLHGVGMMHLAWPTGSPDVTLPLPISPLPPGHQVNRKCLLPLTSDPGCLAIKLYLCSHLSGNKSGL